MIYQGRADVTLSTPMGELTEERDVVVDGHGRPPADAQGVHPRTDSLKIKVQGSPMKGINEATQIEVVANGGSFQIDLSDRKVQISADETEFSV